MLAVGNDKQYQAFCTAPRSRRRLRKTSASRPMRAGSRTAQRSFQRSNASVGKGLRRIGWNCSTRANVPCGPINSIAEVFEDPQVKHRKMRFDLPHALGGQSCRRCEIPMLFSRTALDYSTPPPLLGEHTAEVLATELGISASEFSSLRSDGVVG